MLTATYLFSATSGLLTATATGTDVGTRPLFLLRRSADGTDEVVGTGGLTDTVTWAPPKDGAPLLVLRLGEANDTPEYSTPENVLLTDYHRKAMLQAYRNFAAQPPKGHPLLNVLQVFARKYEGTAEFYEANPIAADKLLTATIFPR